jgi:nucleolar protein 14
MPPSQLKRLKASLRDQGITGPQKSKKQKKSLSKKPEHRNHKATALASIRESFNPFEFKHLTRPHKHEYVSAQPENAVKNIIGRPGEKKRQGEEARKKSLLPEMHRRNKVGGILDRRIGENDPTMNPEDRMMARFETEQQRKRGNVFDLEDEVDEVELTHGGQSLRFDDEIGDEDYDAASIAASSDGEDSFLKKKRRIEDVDGEAEQPERKKTKNEVMREIMQKSKYYKHERQQQKDDDEDLREELDKDLNEVLAALQRGNVNKKPEPAAPKALPVANFGMNADRAALLAATAGDKDREYDKRVRQLMQEERAKPTERSKTEEEKAKEDAERLKELEQKRMKRMRGEPISDDEEPQQKDAEGDAEELDYESEHDDAAEFGLKVPGQLRPVGVEDEDDFIMDDDLVASDSEADISSDDESEAGSAVDDTMAMDDEDADFLKHVMPDKPEPKEQPKAVNGVLTLGVEPSSKLAFTYPCPRSHEELLTVFKDVAANDTHTVIVRIRALYHAGLGGDNKAKLADFACALIDHVSYLSNQTPPAPLAVIEAIIRHIHSMASKSPIEVATKFRASLKQLQASNDPTPGDLALLTAIGSIFPTSDHFHQVVTPAITVMARWMGLTSPSSTQDVATGAYIAALCLQYQTRSKRYIPELIRYTDLCLKSPHATPTLLSAHSRNIITAAELWSASPSFVEILTPLLTALKDSKQTSTLQNLRARLSLSRTKRRPLLIHNHRALPIKSNLPKFEENFNPNSHYDPDKERAQAKRLEKEFKREKKGAMRELRKDNNFMAREGLREKKEKDRQYEEKYRKLVSEVQGEAGQQGNEYERERRRAKGR